MERVQRERDRLRPGRLDLVLAVTVVALVGATMLVIVDPQLDFVIVDRSLDVAVNSLTTLASAGLAAVALSRYRESGRISSLFQAGALFLLSVVGGFHVLLIILRLDGRVGFSFGLPEQFPVYMVTLAWLTAAVLFLLGSAAAVRGIRARPVISRRLIVFPPLILVAVAAVLYQAQDLLPTMIGPDGIRALIEEPRTASPLPGAQPMMLVICGVNAVLLVLAAVLLRFAYVQNGPVTDGFLSVGLVIAAFAQLHFPLYPGVYTALVTTGDALGLAFYGALLLGIDAEARSDLRALRAAYVALDRLRVTETERAALEERSRLAREIHDGLAQHLWFAKLKHERLSPLVPDEARGLSGEVGQALDAAIVEARQALVTMRSGTDPQMPLGELITQMADDFGNRSGLRVHALADPLPATLPARQQAELLRVIQEALTNVGKHADATVVRVRAAMDGDDLVVMVSDNGRGFDPSSVRTDGLGLRGMEERARLMGGELNVTSAPSDGTTVSLRFPVGMTIPLVPGEDDSVARVSALDEAEAAVETAPPPEPTIRTTTANPAPRA
jgi:signal transduction histidine kinase